MMRLAKLLSFVRRAAVGLLGGLIGLGGAEFRLAIIIGVFRFAALEAVILSIQNLPLTFSGDMENSQS